MTQQELQELQNFFQMLDNPLFLMGFLALLAWSLAWKGIALWKAVRNNQMAWYVAMLLVNTMGILEIIYIFFFSKKTDSKK